MKYYFLIFILLFSSVAVAQNWQLEKDKEGIKIWTKKKEGSKLKEYRGVTSVKTTMDKIISVFKNVKYHESFFYKCMPGSVSLVKKDNENEFCTYMVLVAPMIKNRDAVTQFIINPPAPDGSITMQLEAKPNLVPLKSSYVRIPEMKGFWKFIPKENGVIEVIHQAYSSPGGTVPESLANLAVVDAPYSMLSELKKLLGN